MDDMEGDKTTITSGGEARTSDASAGGPATADTPALRCRLNGERFHSNGVPPKLLKALEGLFRDAVRRSYLQDNPERRRLPRGYIGGIDIDISSEAGGETYVSLSCNGKVNSIPAATGRDYVERTYSEIATAIQTQNQPAPATQSSNQVPSQMLDHLKKLRNGLVGREVIEILDPVEENGKVTLTPETRHRIFQKPKIVGSKEAVVVIGAVTQVDKTQMTFQITLGTGSKLRAPIPPRHLAVVLDLLSESENGKFAFVRGIGKFNDDFELLELASVKDIEMLVLSDVKTRLDEFRVLEDGWLNGEGIAPSSDGLDWLEQVFATHYPQDLLRPYLYPMPEGGVQAEWHLGKIWAILEIDLNTCTGWWYQDNHETEEDEERDLDLTDASSWGWMEEKVRMMERTKW